MRTGQEYVCSWVKGGITGKAAIYVLSALSVSCLSHSVSSLSLILGFSHTHIPSGQYTNLSSQHTLQK